MTAADRPPPTAPGGPPDSWVPMARNSGELGCPLMDDHERLVWWPSESTPPGASHLVFEVHGWLADWDEPSGFHWREELIGGSESPLVRSRTTTATNWADTKASSCSHTRSVVHPCSTSRASTSWSRSTFRSSFGPQYAVFAFGLFPWEGHLCQKHPSTKTATRARVNTTSGRMTRPGSRTGWFLRNRRPKACSAERSRTSGCDPTFRFPRITAETASEVGCGYSLTGPSSRRH